MLVATMLLLLLPVCSCSRRGAEEAQDRPPAAVPTADTLESAPAVNEPTGRRQPRVHLRFPEESAAGPHPLLILLHPYGGIADQMLALHSIGDADRRGRWIVAAPYGDVDRRGMPYWNATDACCDRDEAAPNHLLRLRALIEGLIQTYDVDRARVVVVGASNGAFMAYRLACEASDLVTGVVALAGTEWADEDRCVPSNPVSILHIHAADDDVILVDGETVSPLDDIPGRGYPSARDTVERWAVRNRCGEEQGAAISPLGPGAVSSWVDCERGTTVEYHRLNEGGHLLLPSAAIGRRMAEFVQGGARAP